MQEMASRRASCRAWEPVAKGTVIINMAEVARKCNGKMARSNPREARAGEVLAFFRLVAFTARGRLPTTPGCVT
jgi:hypothetical protein